MMTRPIYTKINIEDIKCIYQMINFMENKDK